jgi:hypothetical protein
MTEKIVFELPAEIGNFILEHGKPAANSHGYHYHYSIVAELLIKYAVDKVAEHHDKMMKFADFYHANAYKIKHSVEGSESRTEIYTKEELYQLFNTLYGK